MTIFVFMQGFMFLSKILLKIIWIWIHSLLGYNMMVFLNSCILKNWHVHGLEKKNIYTCSLGPSLLAEAPWKFLKFFEMLLAAAELIIGIAIVVRLAYKLSACLFACKSRPFFPWLTDISRCGGIYFFSQPKSFSWLDFHEISFLSFLAMLPERRTI